MSTYIALLRGVNVCRNILKIDHLRELCMKLGAKNVRMYVSVPSAGGMTEAIAEGKTSAADRWLCFGASLPLQSFSAATGIKIRSAPDFGQSA